MIKRAENFWKGMSNNKSQISPIPPVPYGDRFAKFITALTKTPEEVEREAQAAEHLGGIRTPSQRQPSWSVSRSSTDKVIEKAEKQAKLSEKDSLDEDSVKDRTITTTNVGRNPSIDKGANAPATLPVVQEDSEISREASLRDEKAKLPAENCISQQESDKEKNNPGMLPKIPALNRLSLGLGSK